ncbi:MAG TPA: CHRD domain-containing protein [Candidatus Limnocylindrales bacterium]|nr:CHRD domain-containing protein [Candidatus Limnocylindrales bacterium]
MKALSTLSLLLAIGFSAQAALIKFQLSPPGTDVAVGLSASNQVPPATTSTGSGGEISGGIVFDTDTGILQVAVGYGSAAGFTDLTGAATAMHIHGPAGAGTNADVLVSLVPYNFPASDPTKGGVIVGTIAWPSADISALLSGLTYLNIHTAAFPDGEIRGQLIAVNEAPVVVCPAAAQVECGTATPLVALLTDAEGDALSVVWVVNGTAVQTNNLTARGAGLPVMDSLTQTLPLGTNVIQLEVTDTGSNVVSCSTEIVVVDTTPPVIVSATPNPAKLWPPNHKLVPVTIQAQVTDTCSTTTWKIVRVSSNEPVNGHGDGNTSPDWVITGNHTVKLRAERSGQGSGRVYTISLQAKDAAGNLSDIKRVTVSVPHSQGN